MSPYADNNNSQDPGGGFVVENNNSNSNSNNSQQQNVNNNNNNNNNNNKQSLNSSIGTPPPTTSINASGVNLSSINSVNLSSSSSSSSSPSPSPIPVPVIPSSIASISPVLSDIEQVLNAYPSDLPELVVAACWWAESLGKLNNNIPKENIKRFRKELIFSLRERVKGHWYPDYPERGQGFRAIICEETTDRILMDAAKNSDITGDFRSLVKQNTTMWIDPGNVTYRHGKHYEKTLYPFNSSSSSGSYGHYNSHHSSNSINFHQQQLNNSSNSTMIHPQQSQQHIISNTNTNNILLNSLQQSNNNFNYQTPIQINGINTTTTTSRLNLVNSNSNGLVGGSGVKVSSPSLSSTAPIFSPSSLMYQQQQQQHHIQQSNSPPASPSKDLTGNSSNNTSNVYSNNTNNNNLFYSNNSKIKQLAYS